MSPYRNGDGVEVFWRRQRPISSVSEAKTMWNIHSVALRLHFDMSVIKQLSAYLVAL
jgi:hypothetical protein